MKKIKGKKGFAFTSFMIIITLLMLASVVTITLMKQNNFQFKKIGDIQLNTIQTYQKAEKTLFTIDQAAKYSTYKTAYELAENGGRYSPSAGCGDYLGYTILYNKGEDCSAEDIQTDFITVYSKNLENMLTGITQPGSFEYTITQESPLKIVGVNTQMLEFPISYNTEKPIEKTEVCPVPNLVDITDITGRCELQHSICELKQDTAEALRKAQQIAQSEGYELQVTSAYRTYEQQTTLRNQLGEQAAQPSCTSPHVTGGAVDVVLKNQPYMTSAGYPLSDMSLGKRQELQNIMCKAGFVRYKNEFWHYEYNTSRWQRGKTAGVCAIV